MLEFTAFGKNDIRGIYGKDITEELFYFTGKGFVSYLSNNLEKQPYEICKNSLSIFNTFTD